MLFMHFMLDTLDVVSRLSLVMQKDAFTLAEVKDSIERTSLSIQAMVEDKWCTEESFHSQEPFLNRYIFFHFRVQ